jgi:hypothetical protein
MSAIAEFIDTLEDKTFTKMKSLERNNQDLKKN